jgi:hypothetical protein
MLERSKGLADWTKHHTQEIQEIRPHVSDGSSDQSIQPGHLFHLDIITAVEKKNTTLSSVV